MWMSMRWCVCVVLCCVVLCCVVDDCVGGSEEKKLNDRGRWMVFSGRR